MHQGSLFSVFSQLCLLQQIIPKALRFVRGRTNIITIRPHRHLIMITLLFLYLLLPTMTTLLLPHLLPITIILQLLLRPNLSLLNQNPIIQIIQSPIIPMNRSLPLPNHLLPNHLLHPPIIPIYQNQSHSQLLTMIPILVTSLLLLHQTLNPIIQIIQNRIQSLRQSLHNLITQTSLHLIMTNPNLSQIILTNQDRSIQISLGILMVPNLHHIIQMVQDTTHLNLVIQTNPTLVLQIGLERLLLTQPPYHLRPPPLHQEEQPPLAQPPLTPHLQAQPPLAQQELQVDQVLEAQDLAAQELDLEELELL